MITILQSPDKFQPAYNTIDYVVSSDKTAQANFLYVCDIYITGVTSPAYIRMKHSADPTTGFAVFDIHREIEAFLSHDISTGTYGFQTNDNSFVEYQVSFGEEFGTSSSGTTVYAGQTSGTVNYAYNGVFDFLEFQSYIQADYLASVITQDAPPMSNRPDSTNIRSTENTWLGGMSDTSGTIYFAEIRTYTSAGALIQTVKVLNPYQAVTTDAAKFVRFGCGPFNLNLIPGASIYSGAQPIITASVSYYTVTFTNFIGERSLFPKTFVIDDACTNYDIYRIHFLNKLGGFDSFSFIKLSRATAAIERASYKKNLGTLTAITGAYSYAKSDRQDVVFDVNIKDTVTVNSDWITEDESTWLEELVTSPVVYMENSARDLIGIDVLNATYEKRKTENDKIFNLILTFRFTYNRKRQRG